jgi:Ni/Fe-hydrogenase subunit HybB-like protein
MVAASTTHDARQMPLEEPPLILGDQNFASVTEAIARIAEFKTPRGWYVALSIAIIVLGILGAMIAYLFWNGIGVWGLNQPVGWGYAITNFVFWIGIGHAGTLISAILYLFRQRWRTSINRMAEAMTIFAVMCAGVFPAIHVGRPWVLYWIFPIPNQMTVWPNFRSPLLWDVFAVSTYFTVSLLFWYVGMVPDLATLRDRATTKIRRVLYGIFALGWRGSSRHWNNYEVAYLLLAGLATPLVLSVHSVVSFDFAVSVLPGWHTTIFPPYFVAGAIFSGFAMVMTLMIPTRKLLHLENFVTLRHLENMNKIILATGLMVAYAYGLEIFTAWYSGNAYERFTALSRMRGPYAWGYWTMIFCNVVVPQFYWFRGLRRNIPWMFVASILINIGMWFERFVIIVGSLAQDYLPSSWGYYRPTMIDVLTLLGTFGLFFTMFLLFIRFLPIMAMAEVKAIMPQAHPHPLAHPEKE